MNHYEPFYAANDSVTGPMAAGMPRIRPDQIVEMIHPFGEDTDPSDVTGDDNSDPLKDILFLELFMHLKGMIADFDPKDADSKNLLSVVGQLCTDEQILSILNLWIVNDPGFLNRYSRFISMTVILGYDLGIDEDRLVMLARTALFYVPAYANDLIPAMTDFFTLYDHRLREELVRIRPDLFTEMPDLRWNEWNA